MRNRFIIKNLLAIENYYTVLVTSRDLLQAWLILGI